MGSLLTIKNSGQYIHTYPESYNRTNPWKVQQKNRIRSISGRKNLWKVYDEPSEYIIAVLDENLSIPIALEKIKDEIELSMALLSLEEDWDYEGALPIDKKIYITAISFLVEYANFLFRNRSVIIASPEINPCKDGTIDLSWRATKARLLINFRYSEGSRIYAYYYGDFYNNMTPIKGFVAVDEFSESLAIWMKSLA